MAPPRGGRASGPDARRPEPKGPGRGTVVTLAVVAGLVLLVALAKLTLDARGPLPFGTQPARSSDRDHGGKAKQERRAAPARSGGGELLNG